MTNEEQVQALRADLQELLNEHEEAADPILLEEIEEAINGVTKELLELK